MNIVDSDALRGGARVVIAAVGVLPAAAETDT